jgi:hypothetical protein
VVFVKLPATDYRREDALLLAVGGGNVALARFAYNLVKHRVRVMNTRKRDACSVVVVVVVCQAVVVHVVDAL